MSFDASTIVELRHGDTVISLPAQNVRVEFAHTPREIAPLGRMNELFAGRREITATATFTPGPGWDAFMRKVKGTPIQPKYDPHHPWRERE